MEKKKGSKGIRGSSRGFPKPIGESVKMRDR